VTTNPYHRAVRRWLRSEYGVSPTIRHGPNHAHLTFEYNGSTRRVTLHNDSRGTDVLAMKKRDIRRELGAPPGRTTAPRRKMEDVMTEPASNVLSTSAPSSNGTNARLALYRNGEESCRVKVTLRDDVADRLGGGVSTQRLDDETWVLRASVKSKARFRRESAGWQSVTGVMPGEHLPFGSSPAEAVAIDGAITVHCPTATRVRLGTHAARRGEPHQGATPNEREAIAEKLRSMIARHRAIIDDKFETQRDHDFPTRDHMRRTLALIVEIERRGVFSLVKVDGAWRFRASDVSLEGEG
jgi:hypothetical protein